MINHDLGTQGRFMLEKDDILNTANFKHFVEKHGILKATGYLEAASHICQHLQDILGNLTGEGTVYSVHTIKTNTKLLWQHLDEFVREQSNDN